MSRRRRITSASPRLIVARWHDDPAWYITDARTHRHVDPYPYPTLSAALRALDELARPPPAGAQRP